MEIWKNIDGYEGQYQVSNYGNVRGLERKVSNHTGILTVKPKMLKQGKNHKGYPIVYLSKNNKQKTITVHRLVAIAFIPKIENKPQVNHIDGDKTNNHVDNLEWCDNSENQIHAYRLGLNKVTGRAGKPKRPVLQIDMTTNEVIAEYQSIADAGRAVGCKTSSNIGMCCRGCYGRKSIAGYYWRYKEVM